MTDHRSRLPLAGVLAGLTFGAGLFTLFTLPGGGVVTDQRFTDFYGSSSQRTTAFVLYLALVAGSWLMMWFFTELGSRLDSGALAGFVRRMASVAAAAVLVGGGIALAPTSVMVNSGRPFVGIPIAQTFAHAGLLVVIAGVYSFAAATFTACVGSWRTAALRRWVAVSGVVVSVLLLLAFVVAPAVLLPVWVIIAGLGSTGATATTSETLDVQPAA